MENNKSAKWVGREKQERRRVRGRDRGCVPVLLLDYRVQITSYLVFSQGDFQWGKSWNGRMRQDREATGGYLVMGGLDVQSQSLVGIEGESF